MDTKNLHTFKTIVETGSFTRAAEKLNYTQSTITFQMAQLEKALGAKLFEKLGRNMVLTSAGEQLVPYVDEVLSSLDRLQSFEAELEACQGELRVGVGETLLCYRLPPILKEFHRRVPKARLFLRSMNCYDIRNELCSGGLDIGVLYKEVGGLGANLNSYAFGRYPLCLVAAPEVRAAYPDFSTPAQRIPLPLIINEPLCIFRQIFESYLRERDIVLDHTIELWSIPTIKNLVINGLGISVLPEFAVAQELAQGALVRIPIELPQPSIGAVVAHHKNKWLSPLMKCFMELCREYAVGMTAAVES